MFFSKKSFFAICLVGLMVISTACSAGAPASSPAPAPSPAPTTEPAPAAAEPPAATSVTYTLRAAYSTDDERGPMDWALAELKKDFPDVTMEVEPQLNDNGESLKARIATGDLPDMFSIMPNMIEAAVNTNSILQLDDAVDQYGVRNKMDPIARDNQMVYTDGKIWAIPFAGTSVDLLFYNKKLFADNNIKVPTNYPEFLEAVKAFNAIDITPIPIFAKEAWPIGAYFDMFAQRVNPEGMLALNNGTAKASDSGFVEAIDMMAELVANGVFQKGATSADYDAARSIFHEGRAAMLINGEWDIPEIVDSLGDDADFLDIFPTTNPGQESSNKGYMPGASELGGIAISAKVENPDFAKQVACKLAEYLSKANYVKLGRIDIAFKTDGLTSEAPISDMAKKLLTAKGGYQVKGTVAHSLPNKKFATGFGESLQKLVAGQSAEEFIAEVDALYENTK